MKRLIGLSFPRPGDTRKPVQPTLMIQDAEDSTLVEHIVMTEHQLALLLAGQVITVDSMSER